MEETTIEGVEEEVVAVEELVAVEAPVAEETVEEVA